MKSMNMTFLDTNLYDLELQTFYKVKNKYFISISYILKTVEWK